MAELYIIAGSNGAGKSTIGPTYLPYINGSQMEVFDGDKLFIDTQKRLWSEGIRAHKEAKKIAFQFVTDTFDKLVEDAINEHKTFAYEGHFTNDATWQVPLRFKRAGYRLHLFFMGLNNPNLSELRVLGRVNLSGGHYVSPGTIRDNFYGNLEKLNKYFTIFDNITIFDTSETEHVVLTAIANGYLQFSVNKHELPNWYIEHLPELVSLIE
jgi:predicted ABC-type ATPase